MAKNSSRLILTLQLDSLLRAERSHCTNVHILYKHGTTERAKTRLKKLLFQLETPRPATHNVPRDVRRV